MIIDLILDRKDNENEKIFNYTPEQFYRDVFDYGEIGFNITRAMDEGTEHDVKKALCQYILDNNYSTHVINYINSVNWLD